MIKNPNDIDDMSIGEMGALIKKFDWSHTPLGDPDTWPKSLQTMASVMLDNPFGMYIAWGPEYIQLYNDAYRPIIGDTMHPAALGLGAREAFPEVWHLTSPLFERVMKGEVVEYFDFMLPIIRNGIVDDCYFDISYSPIRTEDGEVGGILSTAIETTTKKKAEEEFKKKRSRRQFAGDSEGEKNGNHQITSAEHAFQIHNAETQKLQRLYEAVTGNTPDLIYILDLNYRFTYANRALLTMWGKTWEEAIGNNLLENGYEPWHAALHEGEIDEIVLTKKPIRGTVSLAYKNLGKRVYDYIFTPVINNEGNVEAVAGTTRDITDFRNTEEELLRSEQQMRTMVETAPLPIGVYIGEEMRIQFANQSIIDIWGKGNDVIGKYYRQVLPELENQEIFNQLDSVYKTGVPFHAMNQRVDLVNGEETKIFYFNYSFTPLVNKDGKIYGVMNTAADVTDLNLAKLALQKSEEHLRRTILKAPVAMCIFKGKDFIVDLANDKMFELWGKTEREVMYKPIFEGLPEAKDQGFEAILQEVYSSGKTFSADGIPITLPRLEGLEVVYLNFVFEPYREVDGIISGILAVAIDVTAQLTARKKIEEREQKFRALSETIPHMIWTASPDMMKNYFNQTFLDYTGLTFDELKGDGWKQIIFPDDLNKELPLWNQSIITREDWTIEKRIRRFDGTYQWYLCHTIAQKDDDGTIIGWIGTNTIIQEHKMKEQQMDEFISIASHEMKTPLTTAKGYMELLLLSLDDNNQNTLYANKALHSVERLHDLVAELLDASKIKNGQLNYNISTFDFNTMLDETLENIQLTAKNHTLQKVGNSSCQITADKERLQQVLINLLSNAIKYSPNADKVITTIQESEGEIQVSVQDFGVGISRQHLDKVFDRYYRVQEHAIHFQGLGIGLFISSNIIQRHKGRMWVESEVGKGSTFYFNLPI